MQSERRVEFVSVYEDIFPKKSQKPIKIHLSIEKRLERLWQVSEKQGWKFSQFVAVALEVLTVLHHRNKLKLATQTPEKILNGKQALS
jgi:hypothetical protein